MSEVSEALERLRMEVERAQDRDEEAKARIRLGSACVLAGELGEAERSYGRALEIYREREKSLGKAACYGNLGLVYSMRGDYKKAKDYFKKALRIHEREGRAKEVAKDYLNLARAYRSIGQVEKAEGGLRKACELFEKLEDRSNLAYAHFLSGMLKLEGEEYGEASKHFSVAREIFNKTGERKLSAMASLHLAIVHKAEAELKRAEDAYMEAFHTLKELNGKELAGAALGLFEIYTVYSLSEFNQGKDYEQNLEKAYSFLREVSAQEALDGVIRTLHGLLRVSPEFVVAAVRASSTLGEGAYETLRPLEIASVKLKEEDSSLDDVEERYRGVVRNLLGG